MKSITQQVNAILSAVLGMPGFRGSIIFVFDVDADAQSIKLKSRLFPMLDI